jgi:hypothetical protein
LKWIRPSEVTRLADGLLHSPRVDASDFLAKRTHKINRMQPTSSTVLRLQGVDFAEGPAIIGVCADEKIVVHLQRSGLWKNCG